MDNLAQNIGIIIGLACVLPIITLGIMATVIFWFGKRQFDRFVAPSTESLFEQYQEMVTQNPNQDHEAHIKKIVGQQAGEDRRQVVLHGLVYTLGILLSFWALGGLV
ncbi:MAG: hypothetical protein KC546_21510, partial [Anaerolineae bacterium]|nr:hypothetical protein [Anaerolineae bacterium]